MYPPYQPQQPSYPPGGFVQQPQPQYQQQPPPQYQQQPPPQYQQQPPPQYQPYAPPPNPYVGVNPNVYPSPPQPLQPPTYTHAPSAPYGQPAAYNPQPPAPAPYGPSPYGQPPTAAAPPYGPSIQVFNYQTSPVPSPAETGPSPEADKPETSESDEKAQKIVRCKRKANRSTGSALVLTLVAFLCILIFGGGRKDFKKLGATSALLIFLLLQLIAIKCESRCTLIIAILLNIGGFIGRAAEMYIVGKDVDRRKPKLAEILDLGGGVATLLAVFIAIVAASVCANAFRKLKR